MYTSYIYMWGTGYWCMNQTWGQLHSNVIDYITINLQFS